ncbi:MAG: hypothetical protein V7K38_03890 [Nostoc sp.]|uniref:hypothetical protein n=1 Tax=Nostoc sp. TaxID=1180 RepID=UPI002FF4568F
MVECSKQVQASPLHHNWLEIKQKTHSTNGLIPGNPDTDVGAYSRFIILQRFLVDKLTIPKRSPPFNHLLNL